MSRRTIPERKRRWASLPQAAEYFGRSQRTIRHYISSGELPAYYVGKRRSIQIDLNDLDDLVVRIPSATARGGAAADSPVTRRRTA